MCIQTRCLNLVYDAAGEEGGRFFAVGVEVECHQSIRPHREVVVHGQNLGVWGGISSVGQIRAVNMFAKK